MHDLCNAHLSQRWDAWAWPRSIGMNCEVKYSATIN